MFFMMNFIVILLVDAVATPTNNERGGAFGPASSRYGAGTSGKSPSQIILAFYWFDFYT